MPSAVGRMALFCRDPDLFLHCTFGNIFRGENQLTTPANRFFGTPAEHLLRASAPIGYGILWFEQEHGVVRRAFDQEPESFFGFAYPRLRPLKVLDIGGGSEPARDATTRVAE